jgi:hypothetical protein
MFRSYAAVTRAIYPILGFASHIESRMRRYTTKEKAKITAGAVTALVIVGWIVVLAIASMSVR